MDVKLISLVRRVRCSREHIIDGSHPLYFSTYAKEKSEREERDGVGGNFFYPCIQRSNTRKQRVVNRVA